MTGYEGPGHKIMGPRTKDFTLQQLESVGDRLRMSYRIALQHLIMGTPYKQAAEALGIPLGSLKSRTSRARAELKKLLEADKVNASIGKAISQGALT